MWPAFEERTFDRFRAYYRFVPEGHASSSSTRCGSTIRATFSCRRRASRRCTRRRCSAKLPNADWTVAAVTCHDDAMRACAIAARRDRAASVAVSASAAARMPALPTRLPPVVRRRAKPRTSRRKRCSLDRHGAPLSELRVDAQRAPPRLGGARRRLAGAGRDADRRRGQALLRARRRRLAGHGRRRVGQRVAHARRPPAARRLDAHDAARGLLDPALAPQAARRARSAQKWDQAQAALRARAHLDQAADPRGLSQSRVVSRRIDGLARRGARALRQGAGRARRARGGDPGRAAARPERARRDRRAARVRGRRAGVARRRPARRCARLAIGRARRRAIGCAPRWNVAPHLAAKLLKRPGRARRHEHARRRAAALRRRRRCAIISPSSPTAASSDGAVVVLDNASGDVLAYVGSSGELSRAPQVDGVAAPRQAGSTLKPFLYALALDAAAHRGLARRRQSRSRSRPRAACTCRRTTTATSTAWSACAPRSRARSTCRRCARWSWSASTASTTRCARSASTRSRATPTTTAPRSRWAAPT